MSADYEVRVPSFGPPCPVCGVVVEPREGGLCFVPGCPAFKLAPLSPEAIAVARSGRSFRPQLSVNGRARPPMASPFDAVTRQQLDDGYRAEAFARQEARQQAEYRALGIAEDTGDSGLQSLRDYLPRNTGPH